MFCRCLDPDRSRTEDRTGPDLSIWDLVMVVSSYHHIVISSYGHFYFVLHRKVTACKLFRALSTFGQRYRLFHAFFWGALRAQNKRKKTGMGGRPALSFVSCNFFWALRAPKKNGKKRRVWPSRRRQTIAKSRTVASL